MTRSGHGEQRVLVTRRCGGRIRRRRFVDQPLEPPAKHFPHHGEIIAGCLVWRANVELAVLVFAKAFRPGHDHGADRVGALNMAVVVNLDTLRRLGKPERTREPGQQALLGRSVREFASERLARIGRGLIEDQLPLTATRNADLDLVAAP